MRASIAAGLLKRSARSNDEICSSSRSSRSKSVEFRFSSKRVSFADFGITAILRGSRCQTSVAPANACDMEFTHPRCVAHRRST